MAALPPRRLISVTASGEMTMSIEFQAPLSSNWMRPPGVEMRPAVSIPGTVCEQSYREMAPPVVSALA